MKKRIFTYLTGMVCALLLTPAHAEGGLLKLNFKPTQSTYKSSNELFIQIFKEERILELYQKSADGKFTLFKTYPICKFSGGLGPKRVTGDFKSPEGFYRVTHQQLKPDSRYYRAINIGFPNQFDRENGYHGSYLMIHGACRSVGCYAMTDTYMAEIYHYAETAFKSGQYAIDINIYPFKMTDGNMSRHRNSSHTNFWRQLKPAYDYFVETSKPAVVTIKQGQYLVNQAPDPSENRLPIKPLFSATDTSNKLATDKTRQNLIKDDVALTQKMRSY